MSQQSKIYAGNLSYDTKEDDLKQFFSQYGEMSEIKLIKDNVTGRSKGFAFITFENQKDADASLKANGTELQGRKLRVNIARDNNGSSRRGGRYNRGGGFGGNGGHWNDRGKY